MERGPRIPSICRRLELVPHVGFRLIPFEPAFVAVECLEREAKGTATTADPEDVAPTAPC